MDREVREPCGSAFLCRLHIEPPSHLDYTLCRTPRFVDDCLNRDIQEVRLSILDPRRAAEGRRVLKRAPTRGAPTGGGGRAARVGLAQIRDEPRGGGRRGSARDDSFVLPTHSLRREVLGEGALRGRSPRTREGRIGPTAQLQWSVVSGQWSEGGERDSVVGVGFGLDGRRRIIVGKFI